MRLLWREIWYFLVGDGGTRGFVGASTTAEPHFGPDITANESRRRRTQEI
jgi:hypothetical protein